MAIAAFTFQEKCISLWAGSIIVFLNDIFPLLWKDNLSWSRFWLDISQNVNIYCVMYKSNHDVIISGTIQFHAVVLFANKAQHTIRVYSFQTDTYWAEFNFNIAMIVFLKHILHKQVSSKIWSSRGLKSWTPLPKEFYRITGASISQLKMSFFFL